MVWEILLQQKKIFLDTMGDLMVAYNIHQQIHLEKEAFWDGIIHSKKEMYTPNTAYLIWENPYWGTSSGCLFQSCQFF